MIRYQAHPIITELRFFNSLLIASANLDGEKQQTFFDTKIFFLLIQWNAIE